MRRALTALALTLGLVLVCASDASAWWNKSWSHRRKLTFDNSGQAATFANFPILVVLNSSRIDYSKTKNDGSDLRLVDADDLTLLDHEIEKWDETGNSYVWVRVPQLTGASNADFIWMYYGNAAAAALPLASQRATWTATYSMVHHFDEATGAHLDSTSNGNNSSVIDVQTQASPTGKIDGADILDGLSTDNIDVPDNPTLDMGASDSFTVEAWVKTTNAGDQMVVSKEDGVSEYQLWTSGGVATFWLNDGVDTARVSASGPTVDDGAWHYLVGRWSDGSNGAEIFVDGMSQGAVVQPALDAMSSATPLVIGEEGDANRGFNFTGTIDEVRVRKSSLSNDDWIYAQFLTQSDSGVGLVGPFISFGPEAAHCCGLGVTETATSITVNGPNRFDIRFNTATGGGIDRFVDAEEDTGVDLVGGDTPGLEPAFFSDEINDGTNKSTAANSQGASLFLLEATPARVKVRQEAFYQHATNGTISGGIKGYGDYSIYGIGRLALGWERRTSVAIPAPLLQQIQWAVHYTGATPLDAWTGYSQNLGPVPSPWSSVGGGAPTAADDFVLAQSEKPSARTDFLAILHQDWANADQVFFGIRVIENWQEFTWIDNNPGVPIPVGSERLNFLTYFKPGNLASNVDPAVTSRAADYRTPSTLTVGPGAQWQAADENTSAVGDFFNEAEGAYALDLDPATGLTLAFDGSGTTRHYPFFKIRRWQSFSEAPTVTLDPDGPGAAPATALVKNTNYKAAVKPVARAQFAQGLLYYSTLQDSASVTSPFVGNGTGTVETAMSYAAGRYGQGAVFNSVSDEIKVVVQPAAGLANIEFDRGRIEFWYRPNNVHTDNVQHYLFDIDSDNVDFNSSRIRIKKESDTSCGGCPNALTAEVTDATGFSRGVTILATNYSWRAGDWVHLALEWDSFDATDNIRAYLNGTQLVPTAVANGIFTMNAETAAGVIRIGNKAVSPGFWNADGIIDEFKIYSAPLTDIAHGGLTTDGREYLASSSNNFSLALAPVDATARGPYLFFGFDSKAKGLNVSLATSGAGVADNQVQWFFWNGTTWQSAAPTDGTNSFKKTGTISWNADWPGWSAYSLNGGPELYYMMARLGGVVSYTTTPVERQIRTDILLFQYCNDVTTAAATFAFGVPPTTEVKLESFSALPGDTSVLLEWRTASELANLGFHLYRSASDSGPWTRLTSSLIPGLGSSATGQAYAFRDAGLVNGTRYFYRLEDVDASAKSTFHGPVSAVPNPAVPAGSEGTGGGNGSESGSKKRAASSSCPDWVLSAYGSVTGASATASLTCSRQGDPEAVSLEVVSRDARQATLELRTGGFYALREPSGTVRVFVPGFDFPQDEKAAALPIRRALVDAVVGRRVQLGGVRALEHQSFKGLTPSALGKAEMKVGWDGTVRATRRRARGLARAFPKQELVTLLPSVFQGETKSAVVEIAPLRFDAQRQQLVLAKRVRVKLLFTGREAGESGRGSVGRAPSSRKTAVTGATLARLYTTSRGLHSVSFEQLFPGRVRGFSASQLRLERQDEAVGFHLEPSSTSFGPGSRLYFFADRGAASTDFTGEVAFELVEARDGVQMPLVAAAPSGGAISSASTGRASFETDRFYQPGLLEAPDPWLWEALASGATRVKSFSLTGVSPSGTAALDVELQGASESGEAVDHHLSVSLNGTLVGETQYAGKRPYRMSLCVPASLLREGANDLQLTNVADTGVSSLVFLDRFSLGYPQTASLGNGVFEGTWAESGTATLSGLTAAPALVDVTASPRWLTGHQASGGSLRFFAEAGHRYLAASQPRSPRVALPEPSTLRAVTNQADYVLVAPRAFLSAAGPLVARRQDQGLSTRAVAFEEIASEFGHGQPSAEAIKSFLAYAYQSWARPSPRYVLLLGDASYDPRNFMGTSGPAPLPALWTKTSYLWTASDPLLAAVNGEDALPDLAIGRLPATTVEQAEALVAKLLAWEDSGQGLAGAATLVADNPDLAGDFEADVQDVAQSFLPGRHQLLLLSELGGELRPRIQEALDGGLSYLNYVGHGGAAVWASENVWNSWDAPSLQAQSRQPLLVTMNCLNGYFVAPAFESLSESLIKAEGRGAIASFSPSGLSLDGPAHQYHRALMAELTSGQHARLGDAVLAAQKAYAGTGLMPELISVYHLLGDPATRIQP